VDVVVPDSDVRQRLASYLRERGYLVRLSRGRNTMRVQPLNAVSERHDRSVLERELREWRADNRGLIVEFP
jgi:predicted transcriptional regulator of viral defense system